MAQPPNFTPALSLKRADTPSFGSVLANLIQEVDLRQQHADRLVESLALGEPVELHEVMLALNEAQNALSLMLQVRNKILDAYQELMRTSF